MIFRRILNLLLKFGFYDRHYRITYEGDVASSNRIWSSAHWSVRSAMKNQYAKVFAVLLLKEKVKKMNEMSMVVFYNTRHDCDNLSSLSKIMVDVIKEKYLPDDDTRYYKSYHCAFDNDLKKGTVEFHIIGR